MAQWQIIRISKNWQSSFFSGKFIFSQKRAQNIPKMEFFGFFWNILSLVFLENNLKWKLILLLSKFWLLSCGLKCSQPIKLQDSLKCNIWRKEWMMKFIFWHAGKNRSLLQDDTIILGVCNQSWPKYPQSKKFGYLCNISRIAWGEHEVDFLPANKHESFLWVGSVEWICKLSVCIARHAQSTLTIILQNLCNISRKT